MRPKVWQPPVALAAVEQQIISRIKRAKLFVFFSSMRARKVRAFEEFEEALVWLSKPDKTRSSEEEVEFEVKPTINLNPRFARKHPPSNN